MSYINPISAVAAIIAIVSLTYSNFIKADISFAQKPVDSRLTLSILNPINEVSSGSIIYALSDRSVFTQMALDTKVQMDITGTINRVKLEQSFTNPSNDWVDGIYVFPLPTDSAVDHLTMYVGNRTIEGHIKERKEAQKIYDKAKKSGKKASLIEQQRPNIFTTKVANIGPGETIKIAIEYQQTVKIDQNKFSIRFPMTLGERYIPGKAIATPKDHAGIKSNTHNVKDASKITPPISTTIDRPISLSINLKAGFNTANVNASYHDVNIVEINNLTKHITLNNTKGNNQADRDFELVWQANNSLTPELALFTQQKGDDHYLMLMATPPADKVFKQFNIPRELIFIIDSSGSMMGASMIQASRALAQAVNRLNPTDRFNIIDFDSGFDPLFDSAMLAIKMNKKHGVRFAENLSAEGGTEPLEAIKFAFDSRDSSSNNYLRQIVFLTDGQVGNEDEIFRIVRQHIDNDRLFTIGIGSTPNSHLMTTLSEYGKGAYTFIGDIAEVQDKMLDLFEKLESPAMTSININFPMDVNADQALGSISDLYKGEVITAVYKLNAIPDKLSISGDTVSGVFTKDINITASNNTTGIDTLWARRKIDQMMRKYRAQYRRIDREKIQVDITNIALEHHLVSKFTSLVAVDITPTKPSNQNTVTQTVANKVTAAKTATNSQLWMMLGLVLTLLAVATRRRTES